MPASRFATEVRMTYQNPQPQYPYQYPQYQTYRKRTAIIGPILLLVGIGAAIVMAFVVKPSVQLLGTDGSCGASAFSITTNADAARSAVAGQDDYGISSGLVEQCISQAHQDLTWSVVALLGGLIVGGMVTSYEHRVK